MGGSYLAAFMREKGVEDWHRSRGVGGSGMYIIFSDEREEIGILGGRILGIIDIFMRRVTLY